MDNGQWIMNNEFVLSTIRYPLSTVEIICGSAGI